LTVETDGGLTIISPMAGNESYTFGISTGGVTTSKIADNAVITAKIANSAVTLDKLASNAVTTVKITDANVTEVKIAAGAVTLAKIAANVIDSTKIKNPGIGSANLAANSVTSAKIQDGTIVAADLASNAVTTAKITDANVTEVKIAAGAVTLAKIAANVIDSTKIKNPGIGSANLAANSVTSAKIQDGTVVAADLASNSVNSAKIVDGSIATADLANGAVTAAKLNAMSATTGQALVYDGTAWAPTSLSASAYGGGGYDVPTVATGCDGSVLYIGVFDYASGTSGDVAKGVTSASNTVDHATLPTLSSSADENYKHNSNYYLCVYKKDGNGGSTSTWENAVNNCANGTYADGSASAGWYLPNAKELAVIYENLENGVSFFGLEKYGTIVSYTSKMASDGYWSSTEYSATGAWYFNFANGSYSTNGTKTGNRSVRCVRRLLAI
jgi:hypothetical protein